jgi:type VI secretion system protein ImpH
MASTDRPGTRDLIAEIRHEGHRFRFPQAVRLLARATPHGSTQGAMPRSLRFRTPVSLAFPASDILATQVRSGEKAAEGSEPATSTQTDGGLDMVIGFMGLTGPSGTLPTHYTELLIDRRNFHRDTSAHAFFDLFSHRVISLFYQAWRKYRFYLAYESGERDGFTRNLLDLVGVGLTGLQQRLTKEDGGVSDTFLIHYAGLLSQKPFAAENLVALIRGYFGVPAAVEQFVGQWQEIPASEQTRLGLTSCALGASTVVGQRAWDRQNKLGIKLGPLDHDQFSDFLPGQPGAAALTELVKFCVGYSLACDVTLILKKDAIPEPALRKDGPTPLRLGCNVWVRTSPIQKDADEMQFGLLA